MARWSEEQMDACMARWLNVLWIELNEYGSHEIGWNMINDHYANEWSSPFSYDGNEQINDRATSFCGWLWGRILLKRKMSVNDEDKLHMRVVHVINVNMPVYEKNKSMKRSHPSIYLSIQPPIQAFRNGTPHIPTKKTQAQHVDRPSDR
jgi:hypothetical protein